MPEFRRLFHLDKPETTQQPTYEKESSTPSVTAPLIVPDQSAKSSKLAEESKEKKSRPIQKTQSHIKGNDNVVGNNVSGDHNVTGNNNSPAGPTAIAPNGIAITGGNVQNPTVNNFGPAPSKPAVVTVCVGDLQNVRSDAGHDGEFRLVLTLTTDSAVDNPTLGFQFSGPISSKGSSASSPDMAINIKEGVTTPTSYAFVLYQTWYPGQRMNVEVYSHESISFLNAVSKHSESFTVTHSGCNSSL